MLQQMSQHVSQLEQQQDEDTQRIHTLSQQVTQLPSELSQTQSVCVVAKLDPVPDQAAAPLQDCMQVPATQPSGDRSHSDAKVLASQNMHHAEVL